MNYIIKRLLNKFGKSKSKSSNAANWKNWVDSTNAYIIDRSDKNGETGIKILDDGTLYNRNIAVNGIHGSIAMATSTAGGVGTFTRKWALIATVDMTKMRYGETAVIDTEIWTAATASPYAISQWNITKASIYIQKESNTGTQCVPYVEYKKWGAYFDLVYSFATNVVKIYAYAKWHNYAYRMYCEYDCYAINLSAFSFEANPVWIDTKPTVTGVVQVKGTIPISVNSTATTAIYHFIFDDELTIYQAFYSGLTIEYKTTTGAYDFRTIFVHGTSSAVGTFYFYSTNILGGYWTIRTSNGSLLSNLSFQQCTTNRNCYIYISSTLTGTLTAQYCCFDDLVITAQVNRDFSTFNSVVSITTLTVQYNTIKGALTITLTGVSVADVDNNKMAHNVTLGALNVNYNTCTSIGLNNHNVAHAIGAITGAISFQYNLCKTSISLALHTTNPTVACTAYEILTVGLKVIKVNIALLTVDAYKTDLVRVGDYVSGTGIPVGSRVVSFTNTGNLVAITMSEAVTTEIASGTAITLYPNDEGGKTYGNITTSYNRSATLAVQYGQNAAHCLNKITTFGTININYNDVINSLYVFFYGGSANVANCRETINITSITFTNNILTTSNITVQGKVFIGLATNTGTTNVVTISNNTCRSYLSFGEVSASLAIVIYTTLYGKLTVSANVSPNMSVGGLSYTSGAVTPETTVAMKVPSVYINDNICSVKFLFSNVFQGPGGTGVYVNPWITIENNGYTEIAGIGSAATTATGLLLGNSTTREHGIYHLANTNLLKNHTTADIQFTNVKAYDLTTATYVLKKVNTNSLISTTANQRSLYFNTQYPVGCIHITVTNVNPGTYLNGTWVAWGTGRVPLGVDTAQTDFNTVEKTGGATTITLTESQMPSHKHDLSDDRNEDVRYGNQTSGTAHPNSKWVPPGYFTDTTTVNGNRAYTMNTVAVGGSAAHSNVQPYITCYMWKRTA
jgi:hypothetical protein